MFKKIGLSLLLIVSASLPSLTLAAEECKSDGDCKEGNVCILALTPPVCKPPQPAGEPCKRDKVCASNKCDIPAGQDKGICK